MNETSLSQTYGQIGGSLIEKMYSSDYLSIGGKASTDLLAKQSCISKNTRVLDVGSGLGGPSLHIAETIGCSITGLDIMETNVAEANRRAKQRSLENLVKFKLGDATQMPFNENQFEVIIGQDAWCHVADKNLLIQECARVINMQGILAFTDWLQLEKMTEMQSQRILSAIAAPNLASPDQYSRLLKKHNFEITKQEDISDLFITQYQKIICKLKGMKEEISANFGEKIYAIVLYKNNTILEAFEAGKMGGGRLIANWLGP